MFPWTTTPNAGPAETWAERVKEIGYGIEDMLGPLYDREGNRLWLPRTPSTPMPGSVPAGSRPQKRKASLRSARGLPGRLTPI